MTMLRLAMMLLLAVTMAGCASTEKKAEPRANQPTWAKTPGEVNAELGLGYMAQGNNDQALLKLQRALEQEPDLPRAHHYIAELYSRLGENKLAAKHYARAVELDSSNSALRNNYGVFLCQQDRFAEAEKHFLAAVGNPLYNSRMQAYENAGLCAARAGDKTKAEKYLRAALNINPKLPLSLYQMSVLNFEQKDYLRARAYLQRYEEVAQHNAESLWLGVRIEQQLGDKEARTRYVTELGQNYSDSEEWRTYLDSQSLRRTNTR